jgi:hypothetical protein
VGSLYCSFLRAFRMGLINCKSSNVIYKISAKVIRFLEMSILLFFIVLLIICSCRMNENNYLNYSIFNFWGRAGEGRKNAQKKTSSTCLYYIPRIGFKTQREMTVLVLLFNSCFKLVSCQGRDRGRMVIVFYNSSYGVLIFCKLLVET